MRRENFAAGMAKLLLLPKRSIQTEEQGKVHNTVYLEVLGHLSDSQWANAVTRCLREDKFYPPPARLLELAGENQVPQVAQGGKVYDAIVEAYASGDKLSFGEVNARFGEAAEHSFVAAGGRRAFEWCEPGNEPFRRRDFLACWKESVQAVPARALPPPRASEAKQLTQAVENLPRPKGGAGLSPEAILAEIKKLAEKMRIEEPGDEAKG